MRQGTDDDDDDEENFLVDEENEIVEPDVDIYLFVTNDDKTNDYKRRRLPELSRDIEGIINASGQCTRPTGPNRGIEAWPNGSSGPTTRCKKKNTGALKLAFKTCRRDLLGLDGAFIKGPFPDQVLSDVELDSNNGIYPLAYALVKAESKSSWCWTMARVLVCFGLVSDPHTPKDLISMERYYKRKFPSISDGDGEETLPKRIPETMPKPIPKPTPNPSSSDGMVCWSKKYGLNNHVGEVNSYHNKALQKCEILLNQKQSIHVAFKKQSEGEAKDYGIRLNLSVETCRFLLKASLPFRGHDEKKDSLKRGLFLELYDLLASQNAKTLKVVGRTPLNCQLKSPDIQKQICECFSEEVLDVIITEIGDDVFSLLVDESSDVSKKEQMALVLRYVDRLGIVKERFAGVVHVDDTSSKTLKASIDTLFSQHKLSLKQVRGQGYDGASNMRGEFNGLKALILKDNSSAYYVHCFAHQLQLVIVAVAKHHEGLVKFFDKLIGVINVVSSSCKRKDMIRDNYKVRVEAEISEGVIETGRGLNQEITLIRPGDTRWGSHYKKIVSLFNLFPEVIKVLKFVEIEAHDARNRVQAQGILSYFRKYEFVFYLHLMEHILRATNLLSKAFQIKDQNILEAVSAINGTKESLITLRANGFDNIVKKVNIFCTKYDIKVLKMDEACAAKRNRLVGTNRRYFKIDIFNTVLDMQIQEFGDRFNEINTCLLSNMSALSPRASFSMFDASR
ncbi:zinc finger MYM-type protein 1-like protein [Tanacetum coccineum]